MENEQTPDTKFNSRSAGINIIRYTNPVGDQMHIEYELQQAEDVFIEVFDFMGNRKLSSENRGAPNGIHTTSLSSELLPGVYMMVVTAGEDRVSKIITVVE